MDGCFIRTGSPFEKGTKLELLLGLCGHEFRGKGKVCSSLEQLGMGVVFTEMGARNRRELEKIVDSLGKGVRFQGVRQA